MKAYSLDLVQSDSLKIENICHIEAQNQPNWHFPLHAHHDFLEISLAISGEGQLYIDGHSYPFRRGDIAVKNAGVLHAEVSNPDNPLEQVCIGISGFERPDFSINHMISGFDSPVFPTGSAFGYLRESALYLVDLCENIDSYQKLAMVPVLKGFLAAVSRLIHDGIPQDTDSKEHQIVRNVIAYIDQNYTQKIDLESLAKRFYISPFYLSRKFKQNTGYTVNQYVINRRIGEAEWMLILTTANIKEIALRCGYNNLQYFYAVFRKHVGCTPTELRARYAP